MAVIARNPQRRSTVRNTWTCFSRIAALAVAATGLTLSAAPAMAQYYYSCPPGYYFAQGYGCVAASPPPPPAYYYAPPPPPPVAYPAPFIGFGFGFGFGGHDHDNDWHHH
ncbi:MAG TPA: hypothetical protein VJS41_11065 [Stellaceae bacterium]|nr:hypothetical protein [Stellaceae bacterium]